MSKSRAQCLQGEMIRGYKLEELLGSGTMTAVYRARTRELWQQPELIITLLLVPELLTSRAQKSFYERFTRDAMRITAFRHPHIFPLYGYGQEHGYPYLLTPDIEGEILKVRLTQQKRLTPDKVLSIITPVAEALDYLHSESFVYQTLNPSNILIQCDAAIQIIGVGLSQFLALDGLADSTSDMGLFPHLKNIAGGYLGVPSYLAPEVIQGKAADSRSDVYSLGALIFELLSGQPLFTGQDYLEITQKQMREPPPSLSNICPDLPVALELVVNHALHRNPERRFQKTSDLTTAYRHVLQERLHEQKTFALVQTVQKIRNLPSPPPLLSLGQPGKAEKAAANSPSWPYSLLTDIRQLRPPISQEPSLPTSPPLSLPSRVESKTDRTAPFVASHTPEVAEAYDMQEDDEIEHYRTEENIMDNKLPSHIEDTRHVSDILDILHPTSAITEEKESSKPQIEPDTKVHPSLPIEITTMAQQMRAMRERLQTYKQEVS